MIYSNPFQRMLLNDLKANKAVMVKEGILCLHFPCYARSAKEDEALMAFIAAGMPTTVRDEPWDIAACEIFCSQNFLHYYNNQSGEVLFALRG